MKQILLFIIVLSSLSLNAQITNISPNDLGGDDFFGFFIDINDNDLLVNAYLSDDSQEDAGALYHYKLNGTEWLLNQKIVPSIQTDENSKFFGRTMGISDDWIIASIENEEQLKSIIFFKRDNDEWIRHSKIDSNIPDIAFAWNLAIDGNRAVVGASFDFNDAGINTGVAYVYEYDVDSDEWEEVTKLAPDELEYDDFFGSFIYLKDDVLAISARHDDDNGLDSGVVYVFEKNQDEWIQTAKLLPDDSVAGDIIGYRVSGDEDGERIIVSGYGNNNQTGSVYIFKKENDWIQEARLHSDQLAEGDWFGSSIVIEDDRAIVGARSHKGTPTSQGAVFIFEKEGTDWVEKRKIIDPDGNKDDFFGAGLDYQNQQLIIGAPSTNNFQGAAFALNLSDVVAVNKLPNLHFKMYPNPSQDQLIIDFEGKEIVELEIYSIKGALIKSFTLDGSAIDISQLTTGIYILKRKADSIVLGTFIKT